VDIFHLNRGRKEKIVIKERAVRGRFILRVLPELRVRPGGERGTKEFTTKKGVRLIQNPNSQSSGMEVGVGGNQGGRRESRPPFDYRQGGWFWILRLFRRGEKEKGKKEK